MDLTTAVSTEYRSSTGSDVYGQLINESTYEPSGTIKFAPHRRISEVQSSTGYTTAPLSNRFGYTDFHHQLQQHHQYSHQDPDRSASSPELVLRTKAPHSRPRVPLFAYSSAGELNHHLQQQTTAFIKSEDSMTRGNLHMIRYCSPRRLIESQGYEMEDPFGEAAESTLPGDSLMFSLDYSPLVGPFNAGYYRSPPMQQTRSTSSFNSELQTVSPQEIMNDDLVSGPNSAAFMTLASPSWESPCLSTDMSPIFGQESELQGSAHWYPLFGAASSSSARPPSDAQARQTSAGPINGSPISPVFNEHTRDTSMSASVGINKRRGKPLRPIKLEDSADTTEFKRRRNTLAARKSRAKKADTMDAQRDEIERSKELIAALEEARDREADEKEYWKQKYFSQLEGQE